LNTPITYPYGSFSIKLPATHLLPDHQQFHPKYDRFLPHLATYLSPSDIIVDVGVEADPVFFNYLKENINRIKHSLPEVTIEAIQALIGKSISRVTLVGKNGTKTAVPENDGGLLSQPLDQMIPLDKKIRVLKSDVDGFDYDVLDSSKSIIQQSKPILFFECQYEFEYQKAGYINTIQTLKEMGYHDWVIFDNFGEVIIRTHQLDLIQQLLVYIWKQNRGYASRTMYYVDILGVQKTDSPLIDRVLKDYSNQFGQA